MTIMKTESDKLTEEQILAYINTYKSTEVPKLDKLWEYYLGHNTKILKRNKAIDVNNPDNRIPVPYGRKIITTYTGYAFRPKFITYKEVVDETIEIPEGEKIETPYYDQLNENFKINKEWIKTNRAGRNTAIFGLAYELVYVDTETGLNEKNEITNKNFARFVSVDPRELILLYDFSIEPKKKIAIRFFPTEGSNGIVEVYYADHFEKYKWTLKTDREEEKLVRDGPDYPNFFKQIPVVSYYFGDEMNGLIEPVLPLLDAYDTLMSDSMNEFDRFAFAYLVMKNFGLTDKAKKQSTEMVENAARALKKKRIFEYLPENAAISFLTKDIPYEFIKFMTDLLKQEIHAQAHVPDFTMMTGTLTGAAIDRLLFDFENVVSSAEADFDVGLCERIDLISIIYKATGVIDGTSDQIVITHKRNKPNNLAELAQTAVAMKNAGFSRYVIADIMPDDVIPDVDKELERQDQDMEALMPDVENMGFDNSNQNSNDTTNQDNTNQNNVDENITE